MKKLFWIKTLFFSLKMSSTRNIVILWVRLRMFAANQNQAHPLPHHFSGDVKEEQRWMRIRYVKKRRKKNCPNQNKSQLQKLLTQCVLYLLLMFISFASCWNIIIDQKCLFPNLPHWLLTGSWKETNLFWMSFFSFWINGLT